MPTIEMMARNASSTVFVMMPVLDTYSKVHHWAMTDAYCQLEMNTRQKVCTKLSLSVFRLSSCCISMLSMCHAIRADCIDVTTCCATFFPPTSRCFLKFMQNNWPSVRATLRKVWMINYYTPEVPIKMYATDTQMSEEKLNQNSRRAQWKYWLLLSIWICTDCYRARAYL